ncbi:MAG: enoyl-CoA hydratase-related protein [Gaiellales bacterium]
MPLLYELYDLARERGIERYRLMSKAELAAALGVEVNGDAAESPPAPVSGPTEVDVSRRNGYAVLTLRGADNALSLEALGRLADAAEELAADPAVRVVAITGSGSRIFSAGADLASMQGRSGAQVTAAGTDACRRIAALPVPTVALLNGHAVGGAIDLALACDWRYAVQGAKLRFIHNELGYSPPWGGAARLAARIGRSAALRLFATCEVLAAEEARTMGVVDEVVVPARLVSKLESLAARVARSDRDALAVTKRLIADDLDLAAHEMAFAALWDARSQTSSTLPA